MRAIAITNQKGGSGKTTTAVNLASALGARGESVLVIDLDPQASASAWLGVTDDSRGPLDLLLGATSLTSLVQRTAFDGVSIVPASRWLFTAEQELATRAHRNATVTRLGDEIRQLPRGRFGWVLVDCPPTLGALAVRALAGCRELLVPVTAEAMAVQGLAALLETLDQVRADVNPSLELAGVVACRVDARLRLAREVLDALRRRFGRRLCRTIIRESVRLAEAPSHQQPIDVYAPDSAGAEDYRALANELVRRGRV